MQSSPDKCGKTPICQLTSTRQTRGIVAALFAKRRSEVLPLRKTQNEALCPLRIWFELVSTLFNAGSTSRLFVSQMHIVNTTLVPPAPQHHSPRGITLNHSNESAQIPAIDTVKTPRTAQPYSLLNHSTVNTFRKNHHDRLHQNQSSAR